MDQWAERDAEARRIERMYDEVDERVMAIIAAALAAGSLRSLVSASNEAIRLIRAAEAQARAWVREAVPLIYGDEVPQTARTLPLIIEDADERFFSMTRTAEARIRSLVRSFSIADARRRALAAYQRAKPGLAADALAAELERDLARYGITGFVDAAGKRWSLRTYASMAARTTVMRAQIAGVCDRVVARGGDLVRIAGPLDYPDGCPAAVLSGPYSVTGATRERNGVRIITLDEAIRRYGVFHPRCRHWLVPA